VNLLVDTNVVLWWIARPERMRETVRRDLADRRNTIYLSAVVVAELAIKSGVGKLRLPGSLEELVSTLRRAYAMTPLPLTAAHAIRLGHLPNHHRDPFDRLLVSQAQADGLTLVTADATLARYAVPIVEA
jgi:PIN domain nuclease of toxin-antitoxin system